MSATDERGDDTASLEVTPDAPSHFSWLRTRMSMERTLLSWVRTAAALVGFGFTVVQFFERVSSFAGARPALEPHAPRIFGLALMVAGTAGLTLALAQYFALRKHLWSASFRTIAGVAGFDRRPSPTFFVGITLLLVSVWAIAAVVFRLGL
ncbi:YidH family protein [Sandaracinus amylolyticus]|uniref:DUF202 domain-containing protein n=1 Tax=Sandaracinus amylolyticus TaxID=927083 RepID=A0A0F6SEB8_9BACT|nr:DUF202 domain-containing protein [Sandaracinus amylolyticus]AKF04919.1 hypothetical protein DB32_002068 [Sandaracinus amylolyticus]